MTHKQQTAGLQKDRILALKAKGLEPAVIAERLGIRASRVHEILSREKRLQSVSHETGAV